MGTQQINKASEKLEKPAQKLSPQSLWHNPLCEGSNHSRWKQTQTQTQETQPKVLSWSPFWII